MRCLVVEDEPDIRADLARALEAAGFVVDAAADGEAAWYQGDVEDYDAVILDLGLPRLDGLTVLRRWRSAGRTRSEEHTSELQSLMRISYAVFCLTKKKNN